MTENDDTAGPGGEDPSVTPAWSLVLLTPHRGPPHRGPPAWTAGGRPRLPRHNAAAVVACADLALGAAGGFGCVA